MAVNLLSVVSSPRSYRKSTTAIYRPLPSSSLSSANTWFEVHQLVKTNGEIQLGTDTQEYSLCQLLQHPAPITHHRDAYSAISKWLTETFSIPHDRILQDRQLVGFDDNGHDQRQRPDLQILDSTKRLALVQIEVESGGDKERTLRKLTYGLIEQVRYLSNRKCHVTCSGFYFMMENPGQVIQVDVAWDDNRFKFVQQPYRLPMNSVVTEICDVLTNAGRSYLAAAHQSSSGHTLPVSDTFLQSHFQAGAYQANSGHSVVIIDEHAGKVYKHCLENDDRKILLYLFGESPKPDKSVYPEALKFVRIYKTPLLFFEFPLLRPPLTPAVAKQHAKHFFGLVYEAIKQLHEDFHLAHCDVRLANICFDNSGLGVKVIDLDRSEDVRERGQSSRCVSYARSSVMYEVDQNWTLDKVDWKQMGVLIFAVMNEVQCNSYHTNTPKPKSNFLIHLITSGEYREDLYRQWNPSEDVLSTSS